MVCPGARGRAPFFSVFDCLFFSTSSLIGPNPAIRVGIILRTVLDSTPLRRGPPFFGLFVLGMQPSFYFIFFPRFQRSSIPSFSFNTPPFLSFIPCLRVLIPLRALFIVFCLCVAGRAPPLRLASFLFFSLYFSTACLDTHKGYENDNPRDSQGLPGGAVLCAPRSPLQRGGRWGPAG